MRSVVSADGSCHARHLHQLGRELLAGHAVHINGGSHASKSIFQDYRRRNVSGSGAPIMPCVNIFDRGIQPPSQRISPVVSPQNQARRSAESCRKPAAADVDAAAVVAGGAGVRMPPTSSSRGGKIRKHISRR